MENISIKLDERIAKQISKALKDFNYSTKTEFIRDAIRIKLAELEKERRIEKQWEKLLSYKGKFRGQGRFKSSEEFIKWRENEGSEELMKELRKEHDLDYNSSGK